MELKLIGRGLLVAALLAGTLAMPAPGQAQLDAGSVASDPPSQKAADLLHARASGGVSPDRLVVVYDAPPSDSLVRNRTRNQVGGHILHADQDIARDVLRVTNGDAALVAQNLRNTPGVRDAYADRVTALQLTANDPLLSSQWDMTRIQAPTAWDTSEGSGVAVAVLDCGIHASHPDLQAPNAKVTLQQNFSSASTTDDLCNHGTHVAGTIGAVSNNGIGVASVAPLTVLYNGKVLDDSGNGFLSDVDTALQWAADNGARVVNMSLGSKTACPTGTQAAANYAWNHGTVLVAAAGNESASDADAPANCQNVLGVAATDASDALASFSNYGPNVALAAPGTNIVSTVNPDVNSGSLYAAFQGTSMAAPHVAGTAALVWATSYGTGAAAVRDRLLSTADAIPGTGTNWTSGLVDAANAVSGATPAPSIQPTTTATPLPTATATPTIVPTATPTQIAAQTGMAVAYQVDAAHDGATQSSTLTTPLVRKWIVNLGQSMSYPLIAQSKVFVTVRNTSTYGTRLYALEATTGATVWGPVALGGTYYWSAAAYDAGRVFAVNYDGQVTAYDASSGQLLWTQKLGQSAFSSPPTAQQGIVYVGGAGSGGTLFALSETDGSVLWQQSVANGDHSSPVLSDTGVAVSYACAYTFEFARSTGSPLWQSYNGCSGGGGRTAAYSQGKLYARDGSTAPSGYIFDNQSGGILGRFSLVDTVPALAGTLAYFRQGSQVAAIDPASINVSNTGTVKWTFSGDGTLSSAPIVVNQQVYVGSTSGNLYALDALSGQQVWSTNVGQGIAAPTKTM